MNDYKYDLRETIHDLFKCLLYSGLLTLLLFQLEAIVVSLIAVPTETMKQIEPIITYLEMGLPSLYLFLKLGNDYGIQIRDCFKKIAIRGRELAALCCFDTGIISVIFIVVIIVLAVSLILMPSLLELIDNIPQNQTGKAAEIITATMLAPLFE